MKNIARWILVAAFVAACGVSASATPKPAPRKPAMVSTAKKRKSFKHKFVAKKIKLPATPAADRVTEIQNALSRDGYYQTEPNGKWDSNTVAATQKFQSANGLDATGKLDARTLQKLGLGSDVAGMSAPKPPMPAGSLAPVSATPSAAPAPSTTRSSSTAPSDSAAAPSDTSASLQPVSAVRQ